MASTTAITNIDELLKGMSPKLYFERYAFASINASTFESLQVEPVMSFVEDEGITLILLEEEAIKAEIAHDFICQKITLQVHSALEAVGFMAKISQKLLEVGVPCNVVAGYYHDHLFIPVEKVQTAMAALNELTN